MLEPKRGFKSPEYNNGLQKIALVKFRVLIVKNIVLQLQIKGFVYVNMRPKHNIIDPVFITR